MPELCERAIVPVEPDRLWREIGDFGAIDRWHPMLDHVEIEDGGSVRRAHAADGSVQVERLLEEGGPAYRLEDTPMPIEDYEAELRVEDRDDGGSEVVWWARFELAKEGDDDEAVEGVRGFLRAGLTKLRERFG